MNWRPWLYGLFAAAIGAIGSAIPLVIIAPGTFNLSGGGLAKLGEACASNALIAVGLYLKQTPLPQEQTTTTTTTLETKTTVVPALPQHGEVKP
jgi:hypothetical protein